MKNFRKLIAGALALSVAFLAGCVKEAETPVSSNPKFRILAGSELKDVAADVQAFGQSKGVEVTFDYTGSLDAVDRLSEKNNYDAVWLSHGKYPQLVSSVKAQIKASEKTMFSRVVLGIKPAKAQELGWDLTKSGSVSWRDVIKEVKTGKLKLAMTNPSGSNTGFVTLVGVAAELSGKGDALEEADIPSGALKELFSGISLTSGSSGDLVDKFKANPEKADAMVNYESTILSLNQSGLALSVVIPKEGVITADYPLMLLAQSTQKPFYDQLIAFVRSPETQKTIASKTLRTPLTGGASDQVVNELPFPASLKVVDALLGGFLNEYAKPASSYFVLDVSGSMGGERLDSMKQMLETLTSSDGSVSGRFATFRNGERVSITPFSSEVYATRTFNLTSDKTANVQVLQDIHTLTTGLTVQNGTAIYEGLAAVYAQAQADLKTGKRTASIVLLTDGENNAGRSLQEFLDFVRTQGSPRVPVFGILYGEANVPDMKALAAQTDGRVFDARGTSLKSVMKTIRSFQ